MSEINSINQTALAEAQSLFEAEGLPFPPVPPELAGQVRRLFKWLWGTNRLLSTPYLMDRYLDEILFGDPADYLIFGQAGHGIHSYAMHYYLVQGNLAIYLQVPWPDITEPARPVRLLETYFAQVTQLQAELAKTVQNGKTLPGRLAVVVSQRGGQWGWLTPGLTPEQDEPWNYCPNPQAFPKAFEALAAL